MTQWSVLLSPEDVLR